MKPNSSSNNKMGFTRGNTNGTSFHQGGSNIMKPNKPIQPLSSINSNEKEKSENSKLNNDSQQLIYSLKAENAKLKEELQQRSKALRESQSKVLHLERELGVYKNQVKKYQQKSQQQKSNSSNNINRDHYDVFNQFPSNMIDMMMMAQGHHQMPDDYYVDPVKEVEDHIIQELCPNPDHMTYEQLLALEENVGSVSKGLNKAQVNRIPLVTFSRNIYPEDKCVVCQYEFKQYEKVRKLPCGHVFHRECVDEWLLKDKACPCCKEEVH